MVAWSEVFRSWKSVFSRGSSVVLALVVAFSFYLVNVLFVNWNSLSGLSSSVGFFKTMWLLSLGFSSVVSGLTFWTVLVMSILIGVFMSLLVAKMWLVSGGKREGVLAGVGVFLGLLVPGCAACGVGLVAVLGLGSALVALPFQGTEIAFLALVLIGYAVVNVSERLGSCKIR